VFRAVNLEIHAYCESGFRFWITGKAGEMSDISPAPPKARFEARYFYFRLRDAAKMEIHEFIAFWPETDRPISFTQGALPTL
jgi:hypothetical protein